ncbi:MAG TPA: hypothetical protein PK264_21980, partial [Hyphomicrobiaceae bacterium]|nr:hypothetical protein [Hyphomicrobiaceae bacterium]
GARPPGTSPTAPAPAGIDKAEPATTVIAKASGDSDDGAEDDDGNTLRSFKALRGETLSRVLVRAGIESSLTRTIVEAARAILKDDDLLGGDEVQIAATPLSTAPSRLSPARLLVYSSAGDHRLSVVRGVNGDYVASADPLGRVDTGEPRPKSRI